jgi:hypothetical protein
MKHRGLPGLAAILLVGCGNGDDASSGGADAAAEASAPDGTLSSSPDASAGGGPDASAAASADASDGAVDLDSEAGPICEVFDAAWLDEASVSAGYTAVMQHGCFLCHQSNQADDDAGHLVLTLEGKSMGFGNGVFPPNLTNSPEGLGCWTNDQIVTAILYGLDPEGGTLCWPMPVWSQAGMDAGAAGHIVDLLRSLPPSHNVVPDSTCVDLDGGAHATDGAADGADGA